MILLKAQNQWSCALACVTSLANDHKISTSQEEVIQRFASHFPDWKSQPGVLRRLEIPLLFGLLDFPVNYLLLTPNKEEFISRFVDHQHETLGMLLLLRTPTEHCLRILSITPTLITVADPDPNQPRYESVSWSKYSDRKPEYLLITR